MFSFIKWIEYLFSKIKKNKGIMFTILSLVSISGIFLSLYFVNFLVEDIAQKTFSNKQKKDTICLHDKINSEKDLLLAIATSISLDKRLIKIFSQEDNHDNNLTKEEQLKKISTTYQNNINKNLNRTDIKIHFYQTPKDESQEIKNGLIAKNTGIFFQAKFPFIQKDNTYLQIEVLSKLDILNNTYKNLNQNFIYILTDSAINKLDRNVLKQLYTKIDDKYAINISLYPKELIHKIKNLDFHLLKKQGYLKTRNDFFTMTNLYDTQGNKIAIALIEEKINKNSLVKLVKNLVNNVTMVALGLIVSMILFLF